MKTFYALLLCSAVMPVTAFADTSLDAVLERLGVSAEREGSSAFVSELSYVHDQSSIKMTDVVLTEASGTVTISTENPIVIMHDPDHHDLTYQITSPDAVITITDLSETAISGKLNAPTARLDVDAADQGQFKIDVSDISVTADIDGRPNASNEIHLFHGQSTFSGSSERGDVSGELSPSEAHVRFSIPNKDMDSYATPLGALRDGFSFSLSAKSEGGTQSHVTPGGASMDAVLMPWGMSFAMAHEGIRFNFDGKGGAAVVDGQSGAGYTYGPYTMGFDFPMVVGSAREFVFSMNSSDLEPNKAGWDKLKQSGVDIDKTPISTRVRITGMAEISEQNTSEDIKISSLSLKDLDLRGFGVQASGTGDLEITPEGEPGVGALNMRLRGVDAFLTALSGGLITEQQAMMAKMSLMMFAKAEPNGEHTIDIQTDHGQVSVNGQRIR